MPSMRHGTPDGIPGPAPEPWLPYLAPLTCGSRRRTTVDPSLSGSGQVDSTVATPKPPSMASVWALCRVAAFHLQADWHASKRGRTALSCRYRRHVSRAQLPLGRQSQKGKVSSCHAVPHRHRLHAGQQGRAGAEPPLCRHVSRVRLPLAGACTRGEPRVSSEGRTASAPYTRKKGVSPVARLGVVRLAHSTQGARRSTLSRALRARCRSGF